MIISILFYALFTGLSGLVHHPWELAVCRFLTGLGIGGEVVSITTLLAENWPECSRAFAVGALTTSYSTGIFLAGWVTVYLPGWRSAFFVGALPAILTLFLRFRLNESEKWTQLEEKGMPERHKECAIFPYR